MEQNLQTKAAEEEMQAAGQMETDVLVRHKLHHVLPKVSASPQ
jgi:hypothetical protein